ncbi:MAG: polysaccharide biosynthesis tyrosine autokinase [Candidatus Omnitrophica bacterium]|nr:polysaccharide biosynthesis tyrosine autokinase [Candidatus Omnitrophota bacterium]MBU1997159.1 polysaccharide biosynthesis tyrosine autokinase [Candidatus Omnitrophota bacterium]
MEQYEITLPEYWRIIRKRKYTVISVFLLVMASTYVFTKIQTPVYQSSLEIKIERKKPFLTASSTNQLSISSGSESMATETRMIRSLPVMRKVVERMEVLPADAQERNNTIHALSINYQNSVSVSQIPDTNILTIGAISNDPQKAALMVTAVADVFIIENVEERKQQSKALLEYIDDQLLQFKKQIANEEVELQKFKQNEKVFEVTKDVKENLDRMTIEGTFEFESEMLKIDTSLNMLDKVVENKEYDKVFKEIIEETSDNYIFVGLKRRLLELEFERFLLLIDYTEKHPSVISKDSTIAELKNKIVDRLKSSSEFPKTLQVESDLAVLIKKLFLSTRKEVLYRIVNRFYGDSGSLSTNQVQYVRLQRNIDRLLASYDNLVNQKMEVELELAKVIADVINVVSPASVPNKPIKPNMKINFLISSVIGLLLGLMVCFIKESVDSSVSTISDIENEIKISMLGIIPHMKKEDVLKFADEDSLSSKDKKLSLQKARLVTITDPKCWAAESIKMLRTKINKLMKSDKLKTILFTSSDKQEGKSTIVANMALSMAQLGKKTMLIALNLRRPTIYKMFGLSREAGLTDILMGNAKWQEVKKTSLDLLVGGLNVDSLLQMPGIDNLNIITCGRPVDNVSEILNSKALDQLFSELKKEYDIIIVDCSPVMAVPDAVTLSDKVDGVILVYKVGQTSKDVLKMAKTNLIKANANLLGVVLNNIKSEAQVGYSAYYYRYYADSSEKKGSIIDKWRGQLGGDKSS